MPSIVDTLTVEIDPAFIKGAIEHSLLKTLADEIRKQAATIHESGDHLAEAARESHEFAQLMRDVAGMVQDGRIKEDQLSAAILAARPREFSSMEGRMTKETRSDRLRRLFGLGAEPGID